MQGMPRSARGTPAGAIRMAFVVTALIASGTVQPPPLRTAVAQTQSVVRDDLVKKLTGKKLRVDKQTGKPRAATEAEARETVRQLTALLARPTATPQVTYRRDGTAVANVEGYFDRAVIARPLANGTFETRCVATLDDAVAFLSGESVALEER